MCKSGFRMPGWSLLTVLSIGFTCSARLVNSQTTSSLTDLPSSTAGSSDVAMRAHAKSLFAQLPLRFEENKGQADPDVRFLSRSHGYSLALSSSEAVLTLSQLAQTKSQHAPKQNSVIHLRLVGANPNPNVVGVEELPGKSNYFVGNDPKKWETKIPNYSQVRYEQVYPGVNLEYYGSQGGLEYDFVLAPNSDPSRIRFEVAGERSAPASIRLSKNGDLLVSIGGEGVRLKKPVVYQPANSASVPRIEIPGSFVLEADNRVRFELGAYDHSRQLIIDPAITYLSYAGGGGDIVYGVAVGQNAGSSKNFLYVAGNTSSPALPVTANAQQTSMIGSGSGFIAKIDPSLSGSSSLIYMSYFGGDSVSIAAIAADQSGNVYLTGSVSSDSFPQIEMQQTLGSVQSAFVTRLNSDGSSIPFSTRFGGTLNGGTDHNTTRTYANAIAADNSGHVYIVGATNVSDLSMVNPLQSSFSGQLTGFASGFNTIGTPSLVYSTYLGVPFSSLSGDARGITIGPGGSLYIVGTGLAIPTVNGFQGTGSGYLVKLNPTGQGLNQILYSTGITAGPTAVCTDSVGNAYLTGSSKAAVATQGAFSFGSPAQDGAFVMKVNPSAVGPASLIYATLLNNVYNTYTDAGAGIAVDGSGNVYVAGSTSSPDFPLVNSVQSAMGGVLQTLDSAKSWVPLGTGISNATIFSLTVDTSTSPRILYATTIPPNYSSPSGSATPPPVTLYKSSDGGLNWHASNSGLQGLWTMATAVDPANDSTLYAATSVGVYRSTDQGSTWSLFSSGGSDLSTQWVTALAFDGSRLYAGTLSGLYMFDGAAWTHTNLSGGIDHIVIDTASVPHILYVSNTGQYGSGTNFPAKSSDSGQTWTTLLDNLGAFSFVAIDPRTTPATVYAIQTQSPKPSIYKSTDAGSTWFDLIDTGLLNGGLATNQLAIDTSTTPATIYVTDPSNGIYRFVDSKSRLDDTSVGLILNAPTTLVAIDAGTATSTGYSTVYAGLYTDYQSGFITELNSTGSSLVFSTKLSGVAGQANINSLARDASGALYVGGFSDSSFLPTVNAFEPTSPTAVTNYIVRTGFIAAVGDAQLSVPAGCTSCTASTQVNVPSGTLTISLPNVTGSTTSSAPTLAVTALSAVDTANFSLSNNLGAYDISTTATFSASPSNPVTICFQAQTVNDPTTFSGLRLIHIVNGNQVDSTSSRDFNTRSVCGSVTSLSPFILINGTPSVTWGNPRSIIYGSKLSNAQLNATASVPGTLTYSPAVGTVLLPGQQTLSVTFTPDNPALYSTVTKAVQIQVTYSSAACNGDVGHSILQPINTDGSSVFKLGSTVPTKFRVCDANGVSVGLPGTVVSYMLIGAGSTSGLTVDEDIYSQTADNAFRWDSTGKQWIFNQATGKSNPSLSQSNTVYRFKIALKDGSLIQFQYGLK